MRDKFIAGLFWWGAIPFVLLIWYNLGTAFNGAAILGIGLLSFMGFMFYRANKELMESKHVKN